jgi:hypothetical protein
MKSSDLFLIMLVFAFIMAMCFEQICRSIGKQTTAIDRQTAVIVQMNKAEK